LRRFLDRLYAASGALAAACLAGICALMLAQALGREFGLLIRGADDITSWLCAASAFFALGHTFRHGELVRVGLLIDRLAPARRRVAEIAALGFTALFLAYMAWAVAKFVYESWKFEELAQGLIRVPIWIPQLSFAIGVLIFLVAVLDELVTVLRGSKPAYQLAEEERQAKGDFSELT
jgi:TRAP-type C4-dicarboxylate transport system permease small subunit